MFHRYDIHFLFETKLIIYLSYNNVDEIFISKIKVEFITRIIECA